MSMMDLSMNQIIVEATQVAATFNDAYTKAWASEQWVDIAVLSLPLFVPFLCILLATVSRGNMMLLAPPGFGLRRASMSLGAFFAVRHFLKWLNPSKVGKGAGDEKFLVQKVQKSKNFFNSPKSAEPERSEIDWALTEKDLTAFKHRVENGINTEKWEHILEKQSANLNYICWRHILPHGGTEYLSRSVVENSKPEEMHEFYNDGGYRVGWDAMLKSADVIDTDEQTKTDSMYWVRTFPVVCGPRDYVFSRRCWRDETALYTVTQGSTHVSKPETKKPRRVTEYFSSWRIRAVEGKDGKMSATECILVHHEEMGVQQDCARLAIRSCMWGVVSGLVKAFYKYQQEKFPTCTPVFVTQMSAQARQESSATSLGSLKQKAPRKAGPLRKVMKVVRFGAFMAVAVAAKKGNLKKQDLNRLVKRVKRQQPSESPQEPQEEPANIAEPKPCCCS